MRFSRDDDRFDATRRLLGAALLVLLIAVVALGFATLFWIEVAAGGTSRAVIALARSHGDIEQAARIAADQSKADADRLALLLNIVFGPVVTLLGSVTGFYFGTQSRK
jgi:hypothetical protein